MSKISKIICFLLTPIFLCGNFLVCHNFIFADSGEIDHIVISEIQIGGESVNDEFIELYNPTDSDINLENWDLKRKTKSGSEYNILNNIKGIIPPRGYFLIVPRANCGDDKNEACYRGETAGDDEYTTNSFLARNNTVLLYDDTGDLIDKVGWGEAGDFEGEIISVNPENGESLERKIVNEIIQNTGNNNSDFILQSVPNPQNFSEVDDEDQEDDNNNDNNDDEEDNQEDDSEDGQDGSSQETGTNDDGHTPSPSQEGNNYNDETSPTPLNKEEFDVIITEFLPNPEDSDRDNEFIEIYNAGETDANLEGWTLEDKMGKIKVFEIPENEEIKAGSYKAFYSDETRIALNNSGDGVVLKNSNGDIISETPISDSAKEDQSYALDEDKSWVWTLRPTAGRENIIKEDEHTPEIPLTPFVKGESSQEGNNKEDNGDKQDGSTVLRDYGAGNNESQEDDNEKHTSSPSQERNNIKYDFSDEIVISEIYPNPEGRDNRDENYEWIELYNCSSRDVDLIGWQIDDILKKGSKPYTIKENKIIKAKSHLVLTNEEIKVIFNNSGDEVNLLWADGTVVDSVSYGKSIEGQSYNWVNDNWAWSETVTPNKNNVLAAKAVEKVLSAESVANSDNGDEGDKKETDKSDVDIKENLISDIEYIKTTVAEAKKLPKFSYVEISGIVSTPPGIFSDSIFYIAGSGIQIYGKGVDISGINIGDEVSIKGQTSEVGGEKRILLIKAENMKIISHNNLIEPKIVSTANVGENTEGYLVTVEGEVVEITKDVFFLDDGSGKVKIYIKPQTGIEKSKIEMNKWMAITGQVSRTTVGYRILPRFQADLKLSRVSGISTAAAISAEQENVFKNSEKNKDKSFVLGNANSVIYAIIILAGVLILIDWGRMKAVKNHK